MMFSIKMLRSVFHMSQEKLANKLNVSRSTVAMWETEGSNPDRDHLLSMASIFGVSVDFLINAADKTERAVAKWKKDLSEDYENARDDQERRQLLLEYGVDEEHFSDYKRLFINSSCDPINASTSYIPLSKIERDIINTIRYYGAQPYIAKLVKLYYIAEDRDKELVQHLLSRYEEKISENVG